LKEKSVI